MSDHRRNDRVSLAYHRIVAERILKDETVLVMARTRVARWSESGQVHPHYVDTWRQVLAQTPEAIAAWLVNEGEHATAARQVSPFAGVLSPKERWAIWRAQRGGQSDPRAA